MPSSCLRLIVLLWVFNSYYVLLFADNGKAVALSNTLSTSTDAYSIDNNIASSVFASMPEVSCSFSNRYNFMGLTSASTGFIFPKNSNAFGIALSYFGYNKYFTSHWKIGYARKITKKFSVGVLCKQSIRYVHEHGADFNSTLLLGSYYELNDHIQFGFYANGIKTYSSSSKLSVLDNPEVHFGIKYTPSQSFSMFSEIEVHINDLPIGNVGLQYQIKKYISLRAGVNTRLDTFGFGVGIAHKQMKIDVGSSFHTKLGLSSVISLCFIFNKSNNQKSLAKDD